MSKGFHSEIERALARPDAAALSADIGAYGAYHATGARDWPDEWSDVFSKICGVGEDDPEKALAYLAIAVSDADDADFLRLMGCGMLEDLLREPSDEIIERVVTEARKSRRFRWLLSCPFKVAVSEAAWQAIEKFRITGPHEEPALETLPDSDN